MVSLRLLSRIMGAWLLLAPLTALAQQLPGREAATADLHAILLRHMPAEEAARVIRELFPAPGQGRTRLRLAVDRRTNTLLVAAEEADLLRVTKVLQILDVPVDNGPPTNPTEYDVRLFWLLAGPTQAEPGKLPEIFKEVNQLGLEKPRLATVAVVPATRSVPFELSGRIPGEPPLRLTASGVAKEKKDAVALELRMDVTQVPAGRDPRPAGSLRTTLTVPLRRMTLIGVTPVEGQTAVFMILVGLRQAPAPVTVKPRAPKEKRIRVQFMATPWPRVLEWLGEQTGLPVVMPVKPVGTFTFVAPKENQGYTIPEVIDLINEGLMAQKYILLRRQRSLVVLPADERIGNVRRVSLDELQKLGKTEVVSVIVDLKSALGEEVIQDVRKLLGPFGEVVAIKTSNRLVIQDTAGNLIRIAAVLKDLDAGSKK